MIFADINWLDISINLLLVIFVIVCLLMSLLILMQRPKQEGLGAAFGGGVTDQVFGARTTNVLQRGTVYLGSMFFILSLVLAILIGKQTKQKSLLDPAAKVQTAKKADAKKTAEVPASGPKSLLDDAPVEAPPAPAPAPPVEVTPAPEVTPPPSVAVPPTPEPSVKPADAVEVPSTEPVPPPAEENKTDKPQ